MSASFSWKTSESGREGADRVQWKSRGREQVERVSKPLGLSHLIFYPKNFYNKMKFFDVKKTLKIKL